MRDVVIVGAARTPIGSFLGALADRVIRMDHGQVVADGAPAELLARAGHDDDLVDAAG